MTDRLTIVKPDDWHLHLRDGEVLQAVLPYTANIFGRAIVMPNLQPPVVTSADAAGYLDRILAALPEKSNFRPLMTAYLTDNTDAEDIRIGAREGILTAVKLYPANATTNSAHGVTDWRITKNVLAAMEEEGLPLLIHGEVTDSEVDIFDREAVFIERILTPLCQDFPGLKIVLEHITTADGAAFVADSGLNIAATITPHHLMINRNAIFAGGIRPHMYCLPIAKRERHRLALRAAATSGDSSFFLGTDSAPHPISAKETDCGCAGIFNAPAAIELYAQVFAEEGALDRLEGFASLHGPAFYGLPANTETVTIEKTPWLAPGPVKIQDEGETILPFLSGEEISWKIV